MIELKNVLLYLAVKTPSWKREPSKNVNLKIGDGQFVGLIGHMRDRENPP